MHGPNEKLTHPDILEAEANGLPEAEEEMILCDCCDERAPKDTTPLRRVCEACDDKLGSFYSTDTDRTDLLKAIEGALVDLNKTTGILSAPFKDRVQICLYIGRAIGQIKTAKILAERK